MKHPALARVFAIVLAVLCLVMLLAGVFGIRSTMDELLRGQEDYARLADRIEEYRVIADALSGTISYEESSKALEERQEQHEDEAAQHRMDLATYTATKSGINQGIAALDEADAQFAAGKQQYLEGLKTFEEQEAAFNAGYAQFQAGKQQLADGWAQYNTLNSALQAAQAQLAGLMAISDILVSDDTDDAEQLQRAAVAAYDGAIASFDQAVGVADSMKAQGGISAEQVQLLVAALAESAGVSIDQLPLEGVTAEQLQQLEDAITQATGMTPGQIRDTLLTQRSNVENGDAQLLLSPEQFAAVREVFRQNKDLVLTAIQAIANRLAELSGNLDGTRAQLAAAQAEMDQMEQVMEQGKAGIEEGRKAMEAAGKEIQIGEAALYENRAYIWYQMGKLEEQEETLKQEKEALDREADALSELDRQAQQQKELEQRETSVRLMLLARDGIAQKVDDGAALLEAAREYAEQYGTQIEQMYRGRMAVNLLMLLGALFGFLAIPAAFEKLKSRLMLIGPVLLCLGCAAGVEVLCRQLGRGDSYSALAVALFALLQLLIVIPREKKKL